MTFLFENYIKTYQISTRKIFIYQYFLEWYFLRKLYFKLLDPENFRALKAVTKTYSIKFLH